MKKFISILLVGALALSLAACGGNSDTLSGKVATDGSIISRFWITLHTGTASSLPECQCRISWKT